MQYSDLSRRVSSLVDTFGEGRPDSEPREAELPIVNVEGVDWGLAGLSVTRKETGDISVNGHYSDSQENGYSLKVNLSPDGSPRNTTTKSIDLLDRAMGEIEHTYESKRTESVNS
jgi:hypothetical protein